MIPQRTFWLTGLALGCIALASGCAKQRQKVNAENSPSEDAPEAGTAVQTASIDETHSPKPPEWEAIEDALRRQHYRLDRVDEKAGVITTMPEVSQHWFEFWRKDVATFKDFLEASMDPVRRWIEVTLNRGANGKYCDFSVVVHKERLSAPDRQFNNSTAVYQFFTDALPSTTGATKVTLQDNRWIDQGRDPAMENYLGRKLASRTGLSFSSAHADGG